MLCGTFKKIKNIAKKLKFNINERTSYEKKNLNMTIKLSVNELSSLNEDFFNDRTISDIIEIHNKDSDQNFIHFAYKNPEFRPFVYLLARHGYVAYTQNGNITKFVNLKHIPKLWTPVIDKTYSFENDLIYTVNLSESAQKNEVKPTSLIVVFSSMSTPFDKASLTRYFEPNFASISKHVPDSVAILRIADLDGIVGGFYMPSINYPNRNKDVGDLILKIANKFDIKHDRIVVYGASKGGSAALHIGLKFGFRAVCVDPIVDDETYEKRYNDTHWTKSKIILQKKEDFLADILKQSEHIENLKGRLIIVSSKGSFMFPSINKFVQKIIEYGGKPVFCICNDKRITDHSHVSLRTLRTVTGFLNMQIQGINLEYQNISIDG